MTKTVDSAIKQFVADWKKSCELRSNAAAIYSQAVDEWNSAAKTAFKSLAEFASWTPRQWTLLYFIGKYMEIKKQATKDETWNPNRQTDVISALYMNFSRPCVPLAMRRKKLTVAEQERLFTEGAILADITGRQRHISIRYMQVKHLEQLYDNKGHRRSIVQQIAWLRQHQKTNFEILPDGTVHVKHHCFITPDLMARLLNTKPYPLKATTLFQLAQAVDK